MTGSISSNPDPEPVTTIAGVTAAPMVLFGKASTGWRCLRADLVGEDELRLDFHHAPDSYLTVYLLPLHTKGPVFRRLSRSAVRYRARLDDASPTLRAEAAALVIESAGAIDARLSGSPGASLAEALGRTRGPTRVPFSPDGLCALLGHVGAGGELPGGFRVHDVAPEVAHGARDDGLVRALRLDLRRADDTRRLVLRVALRSGAEDGVVTTTHLVLRDLTPELQRTPEGETARAIVGLLLQVADHEAMTFEPALVSARALERPREDTEPSNSRDLHLVLNSECHQHCEFCSLRDVVPVRDEGLTNPSYAIDQLTTAAKRGATRLLLTGYDPLTYSRLFDVLDAANRLGFEAIEILSPSTRLADPDFAARVVARLPSKRRIFIPLYGTSAAIHDRVVGKPGAYADVLRALDVLRPLLDPAEVSLTTVVTTTNLGELAALATFARARSHAFVASMPYPNHDVVAPEFLACLPRQTDVVEAWFQARIKGDQWLVSGVAPCIALQRMKRAGIEIGEWFDPPAEPPRLPGTNDVESVISSQSATGERISEFTPRVPCPHADRCALRLACPAKIEGAYADRYGLSELEPVALRDILPRLRHA